MQKTLVFLFTLLSFNSFSQVVFEFDLEKSININGTQTPIPFSQGINSAQIQTIDLTGDGKEEWVIWDINSRQLQVFEKSGESFNLLPELAYFFPEDISGFLVLEDFDGDGKKDLFTSTALGIKAYRNTSQGSQISWTVAQNFLRLDGSGNIQTNNLDTPLIRDLDGDGDLDLVIFNFASGDFLEFYKNTSIERKGSVDIDGFAFPQSFWGNFVFCGCSDFTFGERCDGRPIFPTERIDENARILHAGGHSILYRDFSGDGISDLVLGRDECNTLYYLPNLGSDFAPLFTSFSREIPGIGNLPEFPLFHNGQFIDDDLIISLNTSETSFDYKIDFAKSIVKLDENGNQDPNFVQSQLFDLGENTRPFFKGNKFGGELWLTANVKTGQNVAGQAFRMAYNGSQFELLESDWRDLSELNLLDLQLIEYTDLQKKDYFLISGTRMINNIPTQLLLKAEDSDFVNFNLSGLTLRRGDQLTFFPF
ncbi:MAG TPA: FG-GAP-like repeat-containing protein, partial [Algoriphagus sp.]|nr:FG-GAP-like repeat-containing protein [Algoriphagus sp.]